LVPALRALAEYAAPYGVRIGLQNHGDMLATADQVIAVLKWVDHDNLGIINDTGSFRPFRGDPGGYDWYRDIERIIPYSVGFQIKEHPDGPDSDTPFDLVRFFRALRQSPYRGSLSIERLWAHPRPDPNGPPPLEAITHLFQSVQTAMEETKVPKVRD
jgi:sugar phosphate isomerase/epimerase